MGVRVTEASDTTIGLWAPIAPNINHRGTVFGGSAASLATLAAWSLCHGRLMKAGVDARLVIQRSTMNYLKPIETDFSATCRTDSEESWQRFEAMLARRGKARIQLKSSLTCEGQNVGEFAGDFVALAGHDT